MTEAPDRRETGELSAELALPKHARCAVLGSPIAHSRSPQIHRAAYRVLGLEWQFSAIECDEVQLEGVLHDRVTSEPEEPGAGPWRGFALTMPLKHEAYRLSELRDPHATESGVANTMLRLPGDRWAGFNTDIGGLALALEDAAIDCAHTVVLGAGATAVSALLAARSAGAGRVTVAARRGSAAEELAARFHRAGSGGLDGELDVEGLALDSSALEGAVASATAVISTLPGPAGHSLRLPDEITRLPLFDVAYDPWPSPLAERWRSAGGEAVSGIGMLVHQALLQLRIFVTGDPGHALHREAEVLEAMRLAAVAGVEQ